MTDYAFQFVGLVHGSIGAAMLALLVLSVWLEKRGKRQSFGAGLALCAALQLVQAGAGLTLSAHYEGRLRRMFFLQNPSLAWWLERKEHLAVGAVALTFCALAAHLASVHASEARQAGYRLAATRAAWGAAALSAISFVSGVVVAAGITSMLR